MNYTCPECGGIFPDYMFKNEDQEIMRLSFPAPVDQALNEYMKLFNPAGKQISRKKEIRILKELHQTICSGYVQWKGKAARECSPAMWAEGMKAMTRRKIEPPLENHNYLKAVAYEIADKSSRSAETERNIQERNHSFRDPGSQEELMTFEEFKKLDPDRAGKLAGALRMI